MSTAPSASIAISAGGSTPTSSTATRSASCSSPLRARRARSISARALPRRCPDRGRALPDRLRHRGGAPRPRRRRRRGQRGVPPRRRGRAADRQASIPSAAATIPSRPSRIPDGNEWLLQEITAAPAGPCRGAGRRASPRRPSSPLHCVAPRPPMGSTRSAPASTTTIGRTGMPNISSRNRQVGSCRCDADGRSTATEPNSVGHLQAAPSRVDQPLMKARRSGLMHVGMGGAACRAGSPDRPSACRSSAA